MASPVTIAVCSITDTEEIFPLFLEKECKVKVTRVRLGVQEDWTRHDFSQYDGVILIHSISTGRMSVTDVKDARYDRLLPHLKDSLGRNRVAVLVTGVDDHEHKYRHFMAQQPLTEECSGCVKLCYSLMDCHVKRIIKHFLSNLKVYSRPAPLTIKATSKPIDCTPSEQLEERVPTEDLCNISLMADENRPVHLTIRAEGSTTCTHLKTPSENVMQKTADFLTYRHTADGFNEPGCEHLDVSVHGRTVSSSGMPLCAILIFSSHKETEVEVKPAGQNDFDEMLKTVAKRVVQRMEIDDLGKALGFTPEAISTYIATNKSGQEVTCDGTLQMLRDWRKKKTKDKESVALKAALEKVGQINLASELYGTK